MNNYVEDSHSEMPASDALHWRLDIHLVRQIHKHEDQHQQQGEAGAPVQELHRSGLPHLRPPPPFLYKVEAERNRIQSI